MYEKVSILKEVNVTASNASSPIGGPVKPIYNEPLIYPGMGHSLYPLYNDDTVKHLVDDIRVLQPVTSAGHTFVTAPIKIPCNFDLLGISNNSFLIGKRSLDVADTIDPTLRLQSIYLSVNGHLVKYNCVNISRIGQPSLLSDTRCVNINYSEAGFVLPPEVLGRDLTNWRKDEYLSIDITGSISNSKGILKMNDADVWFHNFKEDISATVVGVMFEMYFTKQRT